MFDKTQNNDLFVSLTAAIDYTERVRDMYTFSELIWNIRNVGKIDSRKMQGQSAFSTTIYVISLISCNQIIAKWMQICQYCNFHLA